MADFSPESDINWTDLGQALVAQLTINDCPFRADSEGLIVWDGNCHERLGESVRRAMKIAGIQCSQGESGFTRHRDFWDARCSEGDPD